MTSNYSTPSLKHLKPSFHTTLTFVLSNVVTHLVMMTAQLKVLNICAFLAFILDLSFTYVPCFWVSTVPVHLRTRWPCLRHSPVTTRHRSKMRGLVI